MKPEVYISYKWEGNNQPALVKELLHYLKLRGHNIKIDYIDNAMSQASKRKILEFMQDLGNSRYVIAVINDEYMRSEYCMYEILETLKYPDVHDRIFPIVIDDAIPSDWSRLENYAEHWENATKQLVDQGEPSGDMEEKLVLYNDIRKACLRFGDELKNMNIFRLQQPTDDRLIQLFDDISGMISAAESAADRESPSAPLGHREKEYAVRLNHIPFFDFKKTIGRQDLISKLHAKLVRKRASLVLIHGIAGIGKTTLALTYINNADYTRHYKNVAWVNVLDDNIQDAMFQDLETDAVGFKYESKMTPEKNFENLKRILKGIKGDNLIVLDSANNIDELKKMKDVLHLLGWKVLITSRAVAKGFDTLPVHELSADHAYELFYRYYRKEKNDALLAELLKNIEYHTLLAELLAKSANANKALKLATLVQLVAGWRLNVDDLQVDIYTEHKLDPRVQLRQQKIYSYINSMFRFVDLDEISKKYLRYFAILPSKFETIASFSNFCQNEGGEPDFARLIERLASQGWLIRAGNAFKAHPLIQATVRENLQPTPKNCRTLIRHFGNLFFVEIGKNPLKKRGWLPYGESILTAIDGRDCDLAALMDNFAKTLRYFGEYEKATERALQARTIRERLLDVDHPTIGDSYINLSVIYRYKKELGSSLEYCTKALRLYEAMSEQDYVKLATVYYKMTLTLMEMGDFKQALAYSEKDLAALERVLDPHHQYFAETYNTRGEIYRRLGDPSNALELKQKALRIREEKLESEHPDLAISYHQIALTYYDQGDYEDADLYIKKAWKIRKKLPPGHPDLNDTETWKRKIGCKL
ncbi:MAG: tetratricopeptide repeat protein [Deltaproteobacteria bacterium]|nr:tetratricopeptide repeat protein [Deltaproteobacteria bacterium]